MLLSTPSLGPELKVRFVSRTVLPYGARVRSGIVRGVVSASRGEDCIRAGYGDGVRVRARVMAGLLRALPRVSGSSRSVNADAVVLRPRIGGPVSRVPACGSRGVR